MIQFPVNPKKQKDLEERMKKAGLLESDVIEKFIRASGHGGQNINKVSTAVYLKHLPSGIEVKMQKERSQSLNRYLAWRLLTEKLEDKIFKEKSEKRKSIEKIRRQKRRRGRKAKEKMLREKKLLSEKKMLRKPLVFLILAAIIFLAQIACAKDLRAVKLENFLTSCRPDSPLVNKIHEILYCADKFNLDYRLYVAIAGVESSYGKVYPKNNSNLTGILNGKAKFDSIYDNIYQTHQLIAEGKWYKKYHRTKKLEDFVYTYKGVPPYEPYIRNMRFILDSISTIPIDEELKAQKAEMVLTTRKNSPQPQYAPVPVILLSWNSIRYDKLEIGPNLITLLGIIK